MMTGQEKIALKLILSNAYTSFEKGLVSHASYRLSDSIKSEDLVQDTFLKTWSYLVREGKINLMKPFLYHILDCLIIDEYRKQKYSSLDELLDKGFEPGSDERTRLVNMIDGAVAIELIDRLPLRYRHILKMRFVEDLSLHEMSIRTGRSRNAMAVQSHRGLEKLRVLYKK